METPQDHHTASWEKIWRQTQASAAAALRTALEREQALQADEKVLAQHRRYLEPVAAAVVGKLRSFTKRISGVTRLKRVSSAVTGHDAGRWMRAGMMWGWVAVICVSIPIVYFLYVRGYFWLSEQALHAVGPRAWIGIIIVGMAMILQIARPRQ